jgi:uncharacterized oxidoreductase
MNISGNTILITGGSSGIGLALAKAFIQKGNTVAICSRRLSKLKEVKELLPKLHIKQCDVLDESERQSLLTWAKTEFPRLNILINNAGIQRRIDLRAGIQLLDATDNEITTNLIAPIRLTAAFIPHLLEQPQAAIINISSGLAYIPMSSAPIYCATKAALHSFSQSLRYQLQETSIKVFEVIPPAVNTDLDLGARKERGYKVPTISPQVVADTTIREFAYNTPEIRIDKAQMIYYMSRLMPKLAFRLLNKLT